jgi:hypothetical protein
MNQPFTCSGEIKARSKNKKRGLGWPQMHGIHGILKQKFFGLFLCRSYASHESVAQIYFWWLRP